MDYSIIESKNAGIDIENITKYMIEDLSNMSAAKRFLERIVKSYHNLKRNPYMYSLCSEYEFREKYYRKIVIGRYLLFYRVEEKYKVIIVRTIYGGRDFLKFL